jgi:hypothetical protein
VFWSVRLWEVVSCRGYYEFSPIKCWRWFIEIKEGRTPYRILALRITKIGDGGEGDKRLND